MPIDVSWLTEGRIIYVDGYDEITLDEMRHGEKEAFALLRDRSATPVHFIVDVEGIRSSASSGKEFTPSIYQEPGIGEVVIIGVNQIWLRSLISFVMNLFNFPFRLASDVEDALDYIYEQDETLPKRKRKQKPKRGEYLD